MIRVIPIYRIRDKYYLNQITQDFAKTLLREHKLDYRQINTLIEIWDNEINYLYKIKRS